MGELIIDQTGAKSFVWGEETYYIVRPSSIKDLAKAFRTMAAIEPLAAFEDDPDKSQIYQDLLEEQEKYIKEYMAPIGDFDNSVLASNINYLIKANGIRIGELETILDVSPGYLSRATKENSSKRLSIDIVWKIASLFQKDITSLVGRDYSAPDATVVSFIEKLRNDTIQKGIQWKKESADELNNLTENEDGLVSHPLFESECFEWRGDYLRINVDSEVVFKSNSFNRNTSIGGDCFCSAISVNAKIYLMNVCHRDCKNIERVIELWMVDPKSKDKEFICDSRSESGIGHLVTALYTAVSEESPRLKAKFQEAIQAYLDDIPF